MAKTIPTVRMTHPGVTGAAHVPVSAVPHHEAAGWETSPAPPKPARKKPAAPAAQTDHETNQKKPVAKASAKRNQEGDG